VAPSPAGPSRGRRTPAGEGSEPVAVNDPLTFLTFVTEHPLGSSVLGTVSSYVSHGAMVDVDGMSCYLPLTGLGDPPPRRAREVLDRGERRSFVVVALDPPRRGAELALPQLARAAVSEPARPVKGSSRRTKKTGSTTSSGDSGS
jgi:ribosomal protein S1